jgi:hypothetical protein
MEISNDFEFNRNSLLIHMNSDTGHMSHSLRAFNSAKSDDWHHANAFMNKILTKRDNDGKSIYPSSAVISTIRSIRNLDLKTKIPAAAQLIAVEIDCRGMNRSWSR